MINLSAIVSNPFTASPFTILRDAGSGVTGGGYFARGGWVPAASGTGSQVPVQAIGVITPADAEEIQMLPEGDRVSSVLRVTTATPLQESREGPPSSEADNVLWNGQQYKVMKLLAYGQYGYYRALVTLTTTS